MPALTSKQVELDVFPKIPTSLRWGRLMADQALFSWHRAQLACRLHCKACTGKLRMRPTAAWKAEHASDLDELCRWLELAETLALISQREGLPQLQS